MNRFEIQYKEQNEEKARQFTTADSARRFIDFLYYHGIDEVTVVDLDDLIEEVEK